jgi:hypothetical protein
MLIMKSIRGRPWLGNLDQFKASSPAFHPASQGIACGEPLMNNKTEQFVKGDRSVNIGSANGYVVHAGT